MSLLHSFRQGLTTVASLWQVCISANFNDCRSSSKQQQSAGAQKYNYLAAKICTGSGCQNVSHTSSALWRADVSTAEHRSRPICLNCSQSPTFTVAAPWAWNSLPDSLHRLSSLEQFKKLIYLKFHLRIRTVSNCKAPSEQLVLPTALYKLSKLQLQLLWWVRAVLSTDSFTLLFCGTLCICFDNDILSCPFTFSFCCYTLCE